MEGGLLSLKWNNHKSTFFHVLSNVRKKKDSYADATLACEGKFYPVHKLVLSSCSEYFEEMFEHAGQAQSKHPFIVLKDIKCDELECLLSYMYVGEVNVVQEKLSGLIKAAECLRIKGLAVPDEEPNKFNREKRYSDNTVNSEPKRRKQEESSNSSSSTFRQSNNRNEERRKSSSDQSPSNKLRNSSNSSRDNFENEESNKEIRSTENSLDQPEVKNESYLETATVTEEVLLDDLPTDTVKSEPVEVDSMYLSDSNSMTENKDQLLMEGYGDTSADNQQHFMDELLGNSSDARQMGALAEYGDGRGESSGSAGGSQQQPMVMALNGHPLISPVWLQQFSDNKRNLKVEEYEKQHQQQISKVIPFDELPFSLLISNLNNRYTCPICDMKFVDKRNFRHHYMVHSGEKPYACLYCPYRARQTGTLNKHMKYRHVEVEGKEINQCGAIADS